MEEYFVKLDAPVHLSGHTDEVLSVAIDDSEMVVATGGADGTVRLWNLNEQVRMRILSDEKSEIVAVDVSSNAKWIVYACSADDVIHLIHVQSGTRHKISEGSVENLRFIPNSDELVFGGVGSQLITFCLNEFTRSLLLASDTAETRDSHFSVSPCGQYVFECNVDGAGFVWSLLDRRVIAELGTGFATLDGTVAPNGRFLVTTNSIQPPAIWNLETQTKIAECLSFRVEEPKTDPSIEFVAGSSIFATYSASTRIRCWETKTGSEIRVESPKELGFCLDAQITRQQTGLLLSSSYDESNAPAATLWNMSILHTD